MKFVESYKLKNFHKHQIGSRNNQGHTDRSGDSRDNCLIACPSPKSSMVECENYRHFKQLKSTFNKLTSFEKLN